MRRHCYALRDDPDSVPPLERSHSLGPLEELIDHPVIVGWANEFLADPYLASEEEYGFRMEMSFGGLRSVKDDPQTEFSPHNGGGMWRMPGATHTYHVIPGKAHAGLARAVWELNPVGKTDGGTMFISGSHSAHPHATLPPAPRVVEIP